MKTKMNLLTAALLASIASLSVSAQVQAPPVRDGSNASRAPLPSQRPSEYVNVTRDNTTGKTAIIANHIGSDTQQQTFVATTPVPRTEIVATTTTVTESVVTPVIVATVDAGPSLNAAQVGTQLRSETTASQSQLTDIEARVQASSDTMAATRSTLPAMNAANTAQIKVAGDDVKATERALRKSIKAARTTSTDQVASDYEAYAAAVARMDTASRLASNQME